MKKKIKIIGIIVAIVLVIGFILYCQDNIRFKMEYESLNHIPYENGKTISVKIPWNNPIQYISGKKVIEVLQKETGIVYFGYNSCPWCRNIIEVLLETAKENNVKTIYYVDTHHAIDSIQDELKEVLNDYLRTEEETNTKRLAVPDVYFIKQGKIVDHHISTVESYKNPYLGMNPKQKQELKDLYQSGMEKMKR